MLALLRIATVVVVVGVVVLVVGCAISELRSPK
jgi:hypothetical protein